MNARDPRWIPFWVAVPEPGQRIYGKAGNITTLTFWWEETFDPQEPRGNMTHWMPVDI